VARVSTLVEGSSLVVVKEFFDRGLSDSLKNLVRPHPGRRAWAAAILASELGVPTPRPFALIEDDPGRSRYLVMEFLNGWRRLDDELRSRFPHPSDPAVRHQKRNLLQVVTESIRRLHDAGVSQPDILAGNIMVRETAGQWEVAFIDLDAARFGPRVRVAQRCLSLGRLDASLRPFLSAADRLRCYRDYAQGDVAMDDRSVLTRVIRVSNWRRARARWALWLATLYWR
jgi:tRNA A-37 threonylcarbamoyl transferase component Bud32